MAQWWPTLPPKEHADNGGSRRPAVVCGVCPKTFMRGMHTRSGNWSSSSQWNQDSDHWQRWSVSNQFTNLDLPVQNLDSLAFSAVMLVQRCSKLKKKPFSNAETCVSRPNKQHFYSFLSWYFCRATLLFWENEGRSICVMCVSFDGKRVRQLRFQKKIRC